MCADDRSPQLPAIDIDLRRASCALPCCFTCVQAQAHEGAQILMPAHTSGWCVVVVTVQTTAAQ